MSTQLITKLRALVLDGGLSRSGLARAAGLHANTLRDLDQLRSQLSVEPHRVVRFARCSSAVLLEQFVLFQFQLSL